MDSTLSSIPPPFFLSILSIYIYSLSMSCLLLLVYEVMLLNELCITIEIVCLFYLPFCTVFVYLLPLWVTN